MSIPEDLKWNSLQQMTDVQLLEVKNNVQHAIDDLRNRQKIEVYSVELQYTSMKTFVKKENAEAYIKELINDGALWDDTLVVDTRFVDNAYIVQYAQDYNPDQPLR